MTDADVIPPLGTRIMLQHHKGTIKFVGEVKGSRGLWFGVDWDVPSRGKNTGEKEGIRYFDCWQQGSGSFIRPSPQINYGCSFLHALLDKYIEVPHGSAQIESVVLGSSNGAIEVQAVGLDKIRGKLSKLENLKEISLDGAGVATADPPGSICKTCPNVRGLNLSNNLLPSWAVVGLIASELARLEVLDLSSNRLNQLGVNEELVSAFSNLKELRLNQTLIRWRDVISLVSFLPSLRSMQVGRNHLKRLDTHSDDTSMERDIGHVSGGANLATINLDENELADWNNIVASLERFSKLDWIILTSNNIKQIPRPESSASSDLRRRVNHLGLRGNLLDQWSSVDALNEWFPNLRNLQFSGNPLSEYFKDFRQLAIASLPRLTTINGSSISAKERADCELYYLSAAARDGPFSSDEERCQKHPRWKDLCTKYGKQDNVVPAIHSVKGQKTLGGKLINLKVHRIGELPSKNIPQSNVDLMRGTKAVPLRVLPTMSMHNFRIKLMKTLLSSSGGPRSSIGKEMDNTGLKVWLVLEGGSLHELDTEDDHRELSWWAIEDESHILACTNVN